MSVVTARADGDRVSLVETVSCRACWGDGSITERWRVTCPNGCVFEASAVPSHDPVKCKVCPGRWASSSFKAEPLPEECASCGGSGKRGIEHMLSAADARSLRDALTAALGDAP